jgi:hypothetical protein
MTFSRLHTPLAQPLQVLFVATLALYIFALFSLSPVFDTAGDAPGYLQAMQVMNGTLAEPATFTPNRILTTFLSTGTVSMLGALSGNYLASWMFVNTLYFFGLAFVSYFLFRRLTGSDTGSILGALFVVGNYDVLVFGLNYLMDLTGWFWFMLSMLFLAAYADSRERRHLWLAVLAAGIGGLFKEYAYVAFAPIGLYMLWESLPWKGLRTPLALVRDNVALVAAAVVPTALVHLGVYLIYGYTYLDWYGMNTSTFAFEGWLENSVRSYLVILSFMLPISIIGLARLIKDRHSLGARRAAFIAVFSLPAFAMLAWPIITERLVFLAVPVAALFAAFAIARHERWWVWFTIALILYVALAVKTDGLILSVLYAR